MLVNDVDHHARGLGVGVGAVAAAGPLVARQVGVALRFDGHAGGASEVRIRGEGRGPGLAAIGGGQPGHGATHHDQVIQLEPGHLLAEGEGHVAGLAHGQLLVNDVDHHARGGSIQAVAFAVGRSGTVARRIGAGHAGIDGLVFIGH